MRTKKNSASYNKPVAWFFVLERARQTHDFELAARAKRELERLGVTVKYRKTARQAKGREACRFRQSDIKKGN